MSIQELSYENAYDGENTAVGPRDIYAQNIYANTITLDQVFRNTNNNFYQWTAVDTVFNVIPRIIVGSFIAMIGDPFEGVLNLPSTESLDLYFGTSEKGIVWEFEILNFTTSANATIKLENTTILTIPAGTASTPSFSKYYFYKKENNTDYLCVNVPY